MRRSRTVIASFVWLLISIAMAVSAQAGQRKDSADKRPSVGRGDSRSYRARGWRGGRGWGRGYSYHRWGRVYEEKPFTFCPPPCPRK